MLDARARDYSLETGLTFPPDSLASIMRRVADTDTADRMDEAGVDISNFSKVEEWIRKREGTLSARGGAGIGKGPEAMVYGVAAAEAAAAAAPPQGATATVPASPTLDPWTGGSADPWTGAAQQQPGAPAAVTQQPEVDPWSLDAFGKGKGKGSGDGGLMQCYNCLGAGHPQFLCASAKGAGKAGTGPVCGNCRGKGHDAASCTIKGEGKHVPKGKGKVGPPPNFFGSKGWKGGKGKGKGKGKIGEFDDAGWAHVGAAAEWNWAQGSDWAAAAPFEAQ